LGLKREPRFHAIEDRIWSLIEEDVKRKAIAFSSEVGIGSL
jgi:hypothetical protein